MSRKRPRSPPEIIYDVDEDGDPIMPVDDGPYPDDDDEVEFLGYKRPRDEAAENVDWTLAHLTAGQLKALELKETRLRKRREKYHRDQELAAQHLDQEMNRMFDAELDDQRAYRDFIRGKASKYNYKIFGPGPVRQNILSMLSNDSNKKMDDIIRWNHQIDRYKEYQADFEARVGLPESNFEQQMRDFNDFRIKSAQMQIDEQKIIDLAPYNSKNWTDRARFTAALINDNSRFNYSYDPGNYTSKLRKYRNVSGPPMPQR